MLGYDREDLVWGQVRWTDLTPPEWRERNMRALAELNSTGIVQPFEKEYFRKDGSRVPVLVGAARFKEGSNEGVAFVLDLTERKRAEEEHERLRHLESVLAHMCCVVRDADRAKDIVSRMRDHIKKSPPRRDAFDLNEALGEAIVMVRNAIAKNRITVETNLMDGLIPVQGDRVQLQQVVVNLVLNAVEAMGSVEAGGRELLVSTEQTEANGVLVAVRDSGPGIEPNHLERVFEAFYTTKTSGVGMGLSICRSIIEAHGGRLWAEANEPRGAVFQFTLPGAQASS
jgi:PAS domain S-box-containing protein